MAEGFGFGFGFVRDCIRNGLAEKRDHLPTRSGFNQCPSLAVWARGFEQDFPTSTNCHEVKCSDAGGHTYAAASKAL